MGKMLTAAAILGALSASAVAIAADAPPAMAPEATVFHLGAFELAALHDAQFVRPNDGKTFGVDAGPGAVEQVLLAAGAPGDKITLSVGGLLLKTPGHVVILDTGLGPALKGQLAASLATTGVTPDQVTDIFITHAHFDHVGGLVGPDGKLTFLKALIHLSEKEWAAMQASAGAKAVVAAIAPQVKAFTPGTPVLPGVTPIAIDGHTAGHVGYEISSGGKKLLDIGDTAHSSIISLARPEWVMGFDLDAKLGAASRRATLKRLAETGELVYAPHFPFPSVGHVIAAGDGYVWKPDLPK